MLKVHRRLPFYIHFLVPLHETVLLLLLHDNERANEWLRVRGIFKRQSNAVQVITNRDDHDTKHLKLTRRLRDYLLNQAPALDFKIIQIILGNY